MVIIISVKTFKVGKFSLKSGNMCCSCCGVKGVRELPSY